MMKAIRMMDRFDQVVVGSMSTRDCISDVRQVRRRGRVETGKDRHGRTVELIRLGVWKVIR